MDTWIMWAVGCSVAYWIGQIIGKYTATINMLKAIANNPESFYKMAQALKNIEDANTEEEINAIDISLSAPEDAILMEIEEVNGQVYAYEKETGQFLAQAQNVYQAALLAAARYPGKKFWHPSLKQDHQTT